MSTQIYPVATDSPESAIVGAWLHEVLGHLEQYGHIHVLGEAPGVQLAFQRHVDVEPPWFVGVVGTGHRPRRSPVALRRLLLIGGGDVADERVRRGHLASRLLEAHRVSCTHEHTHGRVLYKNRICLFVGSCTICCLLKPLLTVLTSFVRGNIHTYFPLKLLVV